MIFFDENYQFMMHFLIMLFDMYEKCEIEKENSALNFVLLYI